MNSEQIYQDLKTPLDNFLHWEKNTPNAIFLRQPYGKTWQTFSYAEVGKLARKLVTAMRNVGLKKGDHVGILSKNCCYWLITDIAIMMGGFVSVPFYASLQGEPLKQVVEDSDIKLLFAGKLEKWNAETHLIPADLPIIRFPHFKGNALIQEGLDWEDLIENCEEAEISELPKLEDLWTILYTSGTTGKPKGVMHSFKNPALVIRIEQLTNFIGIFKIKHQNYFSFLPLNHVGERIGTEINCLATGGTMSFGESIDSFIFNVQDTQPTTFFAVPRIWTKFYEGVTSKIPMKRLDTLFKIPVLSTYLKKKIRTGLGLNGAKIVATGAAITPSFLKEFYGKLDIHLIESYGMTEVCGGIAYGVEKHTPHHVIGKPFPFCEVRIDPKNEEILMKAPFLMLGYYKDPQYSSEVLKDGWMHSGDRGEIDKFGYIRVLGRVNDSFKTAKGEFVVPNPLEAIFEKNHFVEYVCVCGLTSPQPIAMVTLNENFTKTNKHEVEKSLLISLFEANKSAASHEKISTVVVHTNPWTELNGCLTPTMKVRRGKLDEKFKSKYEEWHLSPVEVVWL